MHSSLLEISTLLYSTVVDRLTTVLKAVSSNATDFFSSFECNNNFISFQENKNRAPQFESRAEEKLNLMKRS